MELGATETSVYDEIRTEEVGKCLVPSSVASILKLEAEHRTVNRNKMKEKDICLNLPSCPEPKEAPICSHFPPGSLRTAVVLLFCLAPYYVEQKEIVVPQQ